MKKVEKMKKKSKNNKILCKGKENTLSQYRWVMKMRRKKMRKRKKTQFKNKISFKKKKTSSEQLIKAKKRMNDLFLSINMLLEYIFN